MEAPGQNVEGCVTIDGATYSTVSVTNGEHMIGENEETTGNSKFYIVSGIGLAEHQSWISEEDLCAHEHILYIHHKQGYRWQIPESVIYQRIRVRLV